MNFLLYIMKSLAKKIRDFLLNVAGFFGRVFLILISAYIIGLACYPFVCNLMPCDSFDDLVALGGIMFVYFTVGVWILAIPYRIGKWVNRKWGNYKLDCL